jgi:hypothetical protein
MRGKEVLHPSDKNIFKSKINLFFLILVFILGGILGDHPPRDRTFHLR